MRKKLKNIWFALFSKRLLRKIEKDRSYKYKELHIEMEPDVFHPRYFVSSQLLLDWVENHQVRNKNLLEVGCGSGITSLRASQKGAKVWAIDIHQKAVELLQKNAVSNDLAFNIVHSDLFDNLPVISFDYILINPPFYPKNPSNDAEKAWFCGDNFQYFHRLFQQLKQRHLTSGIFMTLSDDCDLEQIQTIAKSHGYHFQIKEIRKSFFEKNFLFALTS